MNYEKQVLSGREQQIMILEHNHQKVGLGMEETLVCENHGGENRNQILVKSNSVMHSMAKTEREREQQQQPQMKLRPSHRIMKKVSFLLSNTCNIHANPTKRKSIREKSKENKVETGKAHCSTGTSCQC